VLFFVAPAANFDLASFSFQVPILASSAAKQTTAAANSAATVNKIVLVFMGAPLMDFFLDLENGASIRQF
jgi:hypothetical protein